MRYTMLRQESGIYYLQNRKTRRQKSLRTRDEAEARRLLNAYNETGENSAEVNRQIATAYFNAADPEMLKRTWRDVAEQTLDPNNKESTLERKRVAMKQHDLQKLLNMKLLETQPEVLLTILRTVCPSTNEFVRRWQSLAVDLGWLPRPVLPRSRWPKPRYNTKRAITFEEHRQLVASCDDDSEWGDYLECLWWLGAAQTDMAKVDASRVDLEKSHVCLKRVKIPDPTKGWVFAKMGPTLRGILLRRSKTGFFPKLAAMNCKNRATYFKRRLKRLGMDESLTLHCYRYAVIQRCLLCGYPERWAKALVGHSRFGGGAAPDVHDAYLRTGNIPIPSLEEYEMPYMEPDNDGKIISFPGSDRRSA